MSRVDYLAGFFDGEGSIGIYRNGQGVFHLRTQLTQNVSDATTELLEELVETYGGNLTLMKSSIYRKGSAYNWQLNSATAVAFLEEMLPRLRLKQEQAQFAICWYAISQRAGRDSKGRTLPFIKNRPIDVGAEALVKALKRDDLAAVLLAMPQLRPIVRALKRARC